MGTDFKISVRKYHKNANVASTEARLALSIGVRLRGCRWQKAKLSELSEHEGGEDR